MPSLFEYAQMEEAALKKEYSRLRSQFQKQIGRLAAVDKSKRIQAFMPGGYKYQRTIKDIEQLRGRKSWSAKARREDWARRIAELQSLTSARSLSLSGRKQIRKEALATLKESGLTSINASNYDKFISFMNFAKQAGVLDEYASNTVADAFNEWIGGGTIEDESLAAYIQEWSETAESIDLFD